MLLTFIQIFCIRILQLFFCLVPIDERNNVKSKFTDIIQSNIRSIVYDLHSHSTIILRLASENDRQYKASLRSR